MGYKLAGFDVIGCNEIDPRMNKVYVANHHPRLNYLCDIREMVTKELPDELYHLDVLDGSPPCSSFSTAGLRTKEWGKEKKFREGQVSQVLDTLFFDFIALAKRLQPKVVIAENVKGLIVGQAMEYVRKIYDEFDAAGYALCHTLLDASKMGVPQIRERVFFTAIRKDLLKYIPRTAHLFEEIPNIDLNFNEPPLTMRDFADFKGKHLGEGTKNYQIWEARIESDHDMGDTSRRLFGTPFGFTQHYIKLDDVCLTLAASNDNSLIHYEQPVRLSDMEAVNISTFPQDYDFGKEKPHYICGMSVPPVMMAQVASRVYDQWLSKIPN